MSSAAVSNRTRSLPPNSLFHCANPACQTDTACVRVLPVYDFDMHGKRQIALCDECVRFVNKELGGYGFTLVCSNSHGLRAFDSETPFDVLPVLVIPQHDWLFVPVSDCTLLEVDGSFGSIPVPARPAGSLRLAIPLRPSIG